MCGCKEWYDDGSNFLRRILKGKMACTLNPMNRGVWKNLSEKGQEIFSLQRAVCSAPDCRRRVPLYFLSLSAFGNGEKIISMKMVNPILC